MKTAIYPGSFQPWHKGHKDILMKALLVFDKVIVARGINPEKKNNKPSPLNPWMGDYVLDELASCNRIAFTSFEGLLKDLVIKVGAQAVVKGLRNFQDMESEKVQQYYSEDLGMIVPTVYFICDRNLVHVSNSAIKALEKFKC